MGEKTSFKIKLDWALKFQNIEKILEGNYGIGDRSRMLTPEELDEQEQIKLEQIKAQELEKIKAFQALEQEITNKSGEKKPIKAFRIKWLHTVGEDSYRKFLADCDMEIGKDKTTLVIRPKERFIGVDVLKHLSLEVLSDTQFHCVNIYHAATGISGEPLIFDRWFGHIEPESDKQQQSEGRAGGSEIRFDEPHDEGVSPETNQLRAKLKSCIPPNRFPSWLGKIEVEEIRADGVLIVTFEDAFTASWCRQRFNEDILLAVNELWDDITDLVVKEKADALDSCCEDEHDEIDEKLLLQQAVQSLVGAGMAGEGKGEMILNDRIPF